MTAVPGVTAALAHFSATTEHLPRSVMHATSRTILNALGLAIGSSRHPAVEAVLALVADLETPRRAGILGRTERTGLEWAALVNGMAVHVEDFDDTHLHTVMHPGAPIVPAALAVGEWKDASVRELIEAVCLGTEVALRVGNGICPDHFDRGWHVTGTLGHIGSAAAASRLLRFDATRTQRALAIAANQASGLQEALGTMTKCLHPGRAAANGVEAALMAARGLEAPTRPIEGRTGFAATTTARPDYETMVAELGEVWEIEQNTFKPYACGIVSHPAIDAAIELRRRIAGPGAVAELRLTVNPVVLDVMGKADPQDGLQSKFSVYHATAVGLLDGEAGPAQFSAARARDPEVVSLRRRVRVDLDPSIRKDETKLRAVEESGRIHEIHIEHATGSAARPMTDEQLLAKSHLMAGEVLGPVGVEELWKLFDEKGLSSSCRDVVQASSGLRPISDPTP